MQGMTDVTARFRETQGTGLVVFRDAAGGFWLADYRDPDTALNAEAYKTHGACTTAIVTGRFANRDVPKSFDAPAEW